MGDKKHWSEIRFLTETGVKNSLHIHDLLKLVSAIFYQIFIFYQTIALQKL